MARLGKLGLWVSAVALLAACQPETILPGERFDIDVPVADTLPEGESAGAAHILRSDKVKAADGARAISLASAVSVASWPQRGLSTERRLPHLALSSSPSLIWSAAIGDGNSRKYRITADPVSDGSRIFTLDAQSQVVAHSTGGARLWAADLTPPGETGTQSGGGLVVHEGTVYATSGWGTVTALDAASGQVKWRQKIGAVGTAAPVVSGGLLYAVGRNNLAWAIRLADGKVVWTVQGQPARAGYLGGAGAAVDGRIAVLPFAGGQVTAVLKQSGVTLWNAVVGGDRGTAYASLIRDVGADPVIDGGRVYVSNAAGKLAALDAGRGERIWTADEGTMGSVVPAGGSLFFVSDANELIRLDAATGQRVWGTPLPNYLKDKPKNRKAVHSHNGPLVAGGRVVIASDDGLLRFFDPASGALTHQLPLPGGAASNPIVVGGVLYVVSEKGQLLAFR